MKLEVFAIKDTVQGEFMNPFLLRNKQEATRAFGATVNNKVNAEAPIVKFYADMQLFSLGEFDTETGEITTKVEYVTSGTNVKEEA